MELTAFSYSLKWMITFSYLNEEWEEESGCWGDGCIKMVHKNGNISLMGETVDSKSAWVFDVESLDLLVDDLLVVSILPNTHIKTASS